MDGGTQYELLTLFADGGFMMYPLVLCSLVALGVIIAKAWTLWLAHRHTEDVLTGVAELTRQGKVDEAIEVASRTEGPAAAILTVGLRRIQQMKVREGELEQVVTTTGAIELGFLERGLVVLATIANVAPLMGFLGTVLGMVMAFAAIEEAGNVDPGLVAGGIKVALLTTATGLTIAIPVNIGYNFFVTRIDKLIVDMEQGAQEVLNLAWDLEKEGRLEIVGKAEAVAAAASLGDTRPTAPATEKPVDPPAPPATPEEPGSGPAEGGT